MFGSSYELFDYIENEWEKQLNLIAEIDLMSRLKHQNVRHFFILDISIDHLEGKTHCFSQRNNI